jgi:hypothetical protein
MLLPNGSKYISIYLSEILGDLLTNCVEYTQQLEHGCYSILDKVYITCGTTELVVIYRHLVSKKFFVDGYLKSQTVVIIFDTLTTRKVCGTEIHFGRINAIYSLVAYRLYSISMSLCWLLLLSRHKLMWHMHAFFNWNKPTKLTLE